MDKRHIVIGSRRSDLALWQTNHVIHLLEKVYPQVTTEIKIISTKGDEILDKSLPAIGGKGLFTEALEDALRNEEIDLAVHSLKDLPTENAPGLIVGAVPERASSRDVIISRDGSSLEQLSEGAIVGTSSRRRAAQLLTFRADLTMMDIRGNVPTRIQKAVDPEGDYDAIVLAEAGISRLGLTGFISEYLAFEVMLPAPGQGALGIQCRDDDASRNLLDKITHQPTWLAVTAERAFLNALEAGCSAPVAAYGYFDAQGFHFRGRVIMPDGKRTIEVFENSVVDTFEQASNVGIRKAEEALRKGADEILEAVQ